MYLYKSRANRFLKHVHSDEEGNVCKLCGGELVATDSKEDRTSYKCAKCNRESIYTILPKDNVKETNLSTMTLRDKSGDNKKKEIKQENTVEEVKLDESTGPLNIIRDCMTKKKILSFSYVKSKDDVSQKNVEPYKLARDKSGSIILYAFCLEGGGIRTYKLNKMVNLTMLGFDYEQRWKTEDTTLVR